MILCIIIIRDLETTYRDGRAGTYISAHSVNDIVEVYIGAAQSHSV